MKVLIIAVHPDDETLGAGGTLLRHKARGDELFWCVVTQMKEEYGFSPKLIAQRKREIKRVAETYDFKEVFEFDFPTTELTEIPLRKMVKGFEEIIHKIKPEVMYIPYPWDAHSDHRRVYEAIHPFFKSFRYPFLRRVLAMEVISETDYPFVQRAFLPNVWVDISEFIDQKIEIFKIYKSECGESPFPRNPDVIKALALYRGSQANVKFAEAFMLLKEVVK